ncbi:hypothetical protein ACFQ93_24825 [Streptomyces sp. NPDC056601]|uniref:hypothetical protein n=1 Tax=Streptomyces sp. NPDC056601 TaxID=3345875 RepID=UPI0036A10D46
MWPGQQPPGGEQNPQDQNPYQQPGYQQQPNPYQQPGYQQQPNPYQQQPGQQPPGQWGAPTVPLGAPQPPSGNGGGNKTKITAIVAAAAVVVAAGVTGFLVLGGDKEDKADPKPSKSPTKSASKDPSPDASDDVNPRDPSNAPKATIAGWQVVVNPKYGTAFDVPADWAVKSDGLITAFDDLNDDGAKPLITMSAPAFLKEKWCTSDDDKDGNEDDSALAATGTKGQNGAKNTQDVARNDSAWWVFGGYTDQKNSSKKYLKIGKLKDFTTASGIKGSVATTTSSGFPKTGKCDTDGKATVFAFKNSGGDFVSWTFYGAKGVKDEVPDATVQKILSTVRLQGDPSVE